LFGRLAAVIIIYPGLKETKVKALTAWNNLDRDINPLTVQEFLDKRFGEGNVAESTFHGWRKQIRKS
jgi:hypothetical protein